MHEEQRQVAEANDKNPLFVYKGYGMLMAKLKGGWYTKDDLYHILVTLIKTEQDDPEYFTHWK